MPQSCPHSLQRLYGDCKMHYLSSILQRAVYSVLLLVRHWPYVRIHYYLLELAVLFGIIFFNANLIQSTKAFVSKATYVAVYFISNITLLFTQLTGPWALHAFASTYNEGTNLVPNVFATAGIAWTIAVIMITAVAKQTKVCSTDPSVISLGYISFGKTLDCPVTFHSTHCYPLELFLWK